MYQTLWVSPIQSERKKLMKKTYLVLPLLLLTTTPTLTNSPTYNSETQKKLLPNDSNADRALVCVGMTQAINAGLPEILDEFKFDQKDNGKIKLAYDKSIVVAPNQVFTIGIKLASSSISSFVGKSHTFDVSATYRPNGAPTVYTKHRETVVVQNGFKHTNVNNYIKEIGYTNSQVYLTLSFPTQGLVAALDFSFGNSSIAYDRVQVYGGSISDFKGFLKERYAPCHINLDNKITDKKVNIDVPIDSTYDIVSALYTASFGYDEEDSEFIVPRIHENKISTTNRVLGEEQALTLSIQDKSGNTNYITYNVRYVDKTLPRIWKKISSEKITLEYQQLSAENLIERFIATDNYQLSSVAIEGLDFTTAKKKMGTYPFTIKALDSSGNESTLTDEVTVIDKTLPEIDGPTTINLTVTKGMSEEGLLGLFTATDEIDGDIELQVTKNDYSKNAHKKGTYDFAILATDKSGNSVNKNVYINVTDDKEPIFIVNRGTVTTYVGQIIDVMETINSLKLQKIIPDANYIGYTVIDGEDPSHKALSAGTHYVKLLVNTDQGKSEIIDLIINVEEKLEESIITNTKKKTFFDNIGNFFKSIFDRISDFLRNLF